MSRREVIRDRVESALAIYRAGTVPEVSVWELIVFSVRAEIRDATNDEIVDAIASLVRAAVADGDGPAQATWVKLLEGISPLQ